MNDTTAVARQETASRSGVVTSAEQDRRPDAALLPPVDVIEDSTGITLRAGAFPRQSIAQPRRIDIKVS